MKKTKIVATISDLKCDIGFIRELYKEGMNVVRLNTAHQTHEGTMEVVKNVRAVSKKIPLLLDTKGPEIRTNKFEEERRFKKGEKILIKGGLNKKHEGNLIYVSYAGIAKDVSIGKTILVDDGVLEFKVMSKSRGALVCKVMNDGVIKGRKSVNVPGVKIKLPSLTKKDKDYIVFAAKVGIDFIAHSFVRSKKDIMDVQKILNKYGSKAKIIAKIENQEGVDNLDEILDLAYGVMVARGDLGIEIPAEKIPRIQQAMIDKCIARRRPVIVATQMLHTMIENPRATRAEISDIANAVRSGTDAIMLSGETAYGAYPVDAVRTMVKVCKEVEKEFSDLHEVAVSTVDRPSSFLAKSAVRATLKLSVKAIVADTVSGRTARYLAAFRGEEPIFVEAYNKGVSRQLALSYGVYSEYVNVRRVSSVDKFLDVSLKMLLKNGFKKNDLIVVLAGSFGPTHGPSFIEISRIKDLL
jgi:pyruvate kinase